MAIVSGHRGQLTYAADTGGGDTVNPALQTGSIFRWSLDMNRKLIPVTELNKAMPSFLPSHGGGTVVIESYINQTTISPGGFNTLPALVVLLPDGSETARKITLVGWLETIRWDSGIGAPNILVARLVITDYTGGSAVGIFGGASDSGHGEPELNNWVTPT